MSSCDVNAFIRSSEFCSAEYYDADRTKPVISMVLIVLTESDGIRKRNSCKIIINV